MREMLKLALLEFGQWPRIAEILGVTYGGPRSAAEVRKAVVGMLTRLTNMNIDVPTPLHVSCIPDRFFEGKQRRNNIGIHDEYMRHCREMEAALRAGARIGL
jgi:hypothetical protein